MKRVTLDVVVSVLLVVCFSAAPAAAQALADRVPADAVVYVGWRGAENVPGYDQSHLKAIVDQSNIAAVFNELVPQLIARAAQQDANAGMALRTAADVAGPLWRHPTAFFFSGVNFNGPEPMPRGGIICQAGPDAQALLDKINQLQAAAGPDAPPLRAVKAGDVVGISIGYPENESAIAGPGVQGKAPDAIGPSRNFTGALQQVQSDPALIVYVDGERLLQLVDDAAQRAPDPQAQQKWPAVRDALGLTGLKRLICTHGFDGKDWMGSTFIESPTPRKGLVSMLDAQQMPDDLLHAVPADATMVFGGSFDIAKLINVARQSLGEVDPNAQKQFNQVLGIASMYIGRNIVDDVLAPLGEHWLAYTSPTVGGSGISGLVALNKPDDPKKADQGIMSLMNAIANTVSGQMAKQMPLRLTNRQTKVGDLTINYVGIPLVSPAWSVAPDGRLYVGLYPQSIAAASRFATSGAGGPNGGKSILDNPDFAAIRKRLAGDAKISGVTYIDLRRTAGEGYQQALALSRLALGFSDMFGVPSPELVMPPLDVILPHVAPAGSVSWTDDAGWHHKSIAPFPGAEILGSQSSAALMAAPMMASVLLPSLNRAKESANRVKCSSNLRQIGQGMLLYANDHKGKYPDTIDELYVSMADMLGPAEALSVFTCPSSNTSIPGNVRAMKPADQAKWVAQHSDYLYLGRGKTNSSPPDEVVVYEKMRDHGNQGINILYGDGHVEFSTRAAAEKLIKDATGAMPK